MSACRVGQALIFRLLRLWVFAGVMAFFLLRRAAPGFSGWPAGLWPSRDFLPMKTQAAFPVWGIRPDLILVFAGAEVYSISAMRVTLKPSPSTSWEFRITIKHSGSSCLMAFSAAYSCLELQAHMTTFFSDLV